MKYAAKVSYCGTSFSGWQRQKIGIGVQEKIEDALQTLSGRKISITAAGRTDAGVHARAQVISFEMDKEWPPDKLLLAINFHLPPDVSIMNIAEAPDAFDARRSAIWREYRYLIWHGNAISPLLRGFAWWNKFHWNREETLKACSLYQGTHDFGAFCKTAERPDSSVRTVYRAALKRKGNMTIFTVRGNAFLNNMVRIMAGNLQAVGYGKKSAEWLKALLAGAERAESAVTAPPEGLCLWRVGYGEDTPFSEDGIK